MPTAVHEQQWHWMRVVAGSLVDHLEHALILARLDIPGP
jgi:hypothetical protein